MELRRDFELSEKDQTFLENYELPWETILGGSPWVLIHGIATPVGYNEREMIAAIRMETGYPHSELNMVYFYPPLSRTDGKPIGCANVMQAIDGKSFQRWSRHRTSQNPWTPGFDCLETHVYLVEDWLDREFEK